MRAATERRGFAVARLVTHWAEVAGPQIAAHTRPVKVTHGRGGMGATLVLLTTGPAAPLVNMQLPLLRDRVNAVYGFNAIARITLTQTAPMGFAEGQAVFTPAPATPPAPDADTLAWAQGLAARFDDRDFAAAMAQMALNHAARRGPKPRKDTL